MRKILALAFCLLSAPAFAAGQQWEITFYLDPDLTPASTQGICVVDNHTWRSTTFPDWVGDWTRKGDRFRFYGRTGGSLATGEFGQIFAGGFVAGEFAHWRATATPVPVTSSTGSWTMKLINAAGCAPSPRSTTAGKYDPAK
jgi:hypothetical protein